MGLDYWALGGGCYVYDDRQVSYTDLWAQEEAAAALLGGPGSGFSTMASSLLNSSLAYGNAPYFTNLMAFPASDGSGTMIVNVGVSGGSNFVPYNILMSTNVATPVASWNWLGTAY